MDNKKSLDHLKSKIETYVTMYKRHRRVNKWLSFGIKITSAVSAASISILLGLSSQFKNPDLAKNISLILGGILTVLNVWETFFNHKALYVKATVSMVSCCLLQDDLEYLESKPKDKITKSELNDIHLTLAKIIQDNNSHWLELKKENKKIDNS